MSDLRIRKVGRDLIEIMLSGQTEALSASKLEAVFAEAVEERRHVLLSFEACDHIDPDTLRVIQSARRRMEEDGLEVHVFGASGIVRELLKAGPDEKLPGPVLGRIVIRQSQNGHPSGTR